MTFPFAHRDAEIHQNRPARSYHHIRRLDVAMYDPRRVHRLDRVNQLA